MELTHFPILNQVGVKQEVAELEDKLEELTLEEEVLDWNPPIHSERRLEDQTFIAILEGLKFERLVNRENWIKVCASVIDYYQDDQDKAFEMCQHFSARIGVDNPHYNERENQRQFRDLWRNH